MGKKVVMFLVAAALLVVVFVGGIFYFLNNQSREEFVEFETDRIPTLYTLVGERGVTSYTTKITTDHAKKTFIYKEGAVSQEDLETYINTLRDSENYVATKTFTSTNGKLAQIANESTEEGYVLTIDFEPKPEGTEISYSKAKGKLTRYGSAKKNS